MIIGIIGFILDILALYGWFTSNYVFVYIGGIFTLVVDIIGLYAGTNRAFFLSIVLPIMVGLIFFDKSIVGAFVGVSLLSAIFFILSTIMMIIFISAQRKTKNNSKKKNNKELVQNQIDEDIEGEFECSNCNARVKNDAISCPKCGASFVEYDEEMSEEDPYSEESEYNCNNCGAKVGAKVKRCPKCGVSFAKDSQSKKVTQDTIGFVYVLMNISAKECERLTKLLDSYEIKHDFPLLCVSVTAYMAGIWISNLNNIKVKQLDELKMTLTKTFGDTLKNIMDDYPVKIYEEYIEKFQTLLDKAINSSRKAEYEEGKWTSDDITDEFLSVLIKKSDITKIKLDISIALAKWYAAGQKNAEKFYN